MKAMKSLVILITLLWILPACAKIDPDLMKRAEQGDAIAQDSVGDAYRDAKDEQRAHEWWAKAAPGLRKMAEQGNAEAQYSLAVLLLEGRGVAKDEAQSFKWLMASAAQGYQPARDALDQIKRVFLSGSGS